VCVVCFTLLAFLLAATIGDPCSPHPSERGSNDAPVAEGQRPLHNPHTPNGLGLTYFESFEHCTLAHGLAAGRSSSSPSSLSPPSPPVAQEISSAVNHQAGESETTQATSWMHAQGSGTRGRFSLLSLKALLSAGDEEDLVAWHHDDQLRALVLLDAGERSAVSRVLPCSFSLRALAAENMSVSRRRSTMSKSDEKEAGKEDTEEEAKREEREEREEKEDQGDKEEEKKETEEKVDVEESRHEERTLGESIHRGKCRFHGGEESAPALLLAVQYELRQLEPLRCGGAYLKLLESVRLDQRHFDQHTDYTLMFGPDRCGAEDRVHLILQRADPRDPSQRLELHLRDPPPMSTSSGEDQFAHLYTLLLGDEGSYAILGDGHLLRCGHLLTDLVVHQQAEAHSDKVGQRLVGDH
jgi:Calreticulin family